MVQAFLRMAPGVTPRIALKIIEIGKLKNGEEQSKLSCQTVGSVLCPRRLGEHNTN